MRGLLRLFRFPEGARLAPGDVLDHPDLRRMGLRELADLPMPRIEPAREERGPAARPDGRALSASARATGR